MVRKCETRRRTAEKVGALLVLQAMLIHPDLIVCVHPDGAVEVRAGPGDDDCCVASEAMARFPCTACPNPEGAMGIGPGGRSSCEGCEDFSLDGVEPPLVPDGSPAPSPAVLPSLDPPPLAARAAPVGSLPRAPREPILERLRTTVLLL